MLKIKGSTIISDGVTEDSEEQLEFITEGTLMHRGDLTRITYDETEISGLKGCTTSLTILPEKVKMHRNGSKGTPAGTAMEFEKGKRFCGVYDTPYGTLDMEVLTNSITRKHSPMSMVPESLSIDYSISLSGQAEWRQRLDIEILKKN